MLGMPLLLILPQSKLYKKYILPNVKAYSRLSFIINTDKENKIGYKDHQFAL